MKTTSRTALPEWRALEKHAATVKKTHLRDLFAADPERGTRFAVEAEGIRLDYSRQAITSETLRMLLELAQACRLPDEIAALFAAAQVNGTEKRPALHWALRDVSGRPVMVDGVDVAPAIRRVREQMAVAAEKLRSGRWAGHGGKPLTHVVNLGIGGSDLGPQMACLALRSYARQGLQVHFVSNLDPGHLAGTLRMLSPETTLFIIASKTFTTQETMANAAFARAWLLDHFADPAAVGSHFAAVTANPQAALDWGVAPGNVFEFWEWVGGRYSLASAVGLPLMMAIGPERFQELLQGCAAMDDHFRSAPPRANLPLLLALIGVWHSQFSRLPHPAPSCPMPRT